jgi:two-component system response regulator MtrA
MEPTHCSLLLVEDDEATRDFLADNLTADGFLVATATAPGEALRAIEVRRPDLVLLDLMLDAGSGLTVLDRVRAADGLGSRIDPALPVIVVSARAAEVDRVRGFARGADDYMTKPFSYPELVARVRAVLRRVESAASAEGVFNRADLTLDPLGMRVSRDGLPIELTTTEFQVLITLARQPGRVFTRAQLLDAVRGTDVDSFERAIDTHIKNIRRKLEPDPRKPRYLLTIYGMGYKFSES